MENIKSWLTVGAMILNAIGCADTTGTKIRVALFADPASTQASSREAVFELLDKQEDVAIDKVTTESMIQSGFFDNYDVFVLPGGTASGEARAIGVDAGKKIARSVQGGKGLIAICAGGYYVAEGWNPATKALDIINAVNHDGEHWARGQGFISVKVTGQTDEKSSRTMWFENGPIFKPAEIDGLQAYTPLVKYVSDLAAKGAPTGQMAGYDAIIAAPYGRGRVVAFGPHPELSPGLDHWLLNAVKWAAQKDEGQTGDISVNTVLEGR